MIPVIKKKKSEEKKWEENANELLIMHEALSKVSKSRQPAVLAALWACTLS